MGSSAAMCDARKACREGVPSWQYTISSSSTCPQEKRREEAPPRLASQLSPPPSPLTWSRWVRPASRARGIASEMCAACGVGVAVGPCCEEECTVECGREQSVWAGCVYATSGVRRAVVTLLPVLEAVVVPLLAARLAHLDARGVRRSPQRVDEACGTG